MEKADPAIATEDVLKFGRADDAVLSSSAALKSCIKSYFNEHPTDWSHRSTLLSWLWKSRNEVMNDTCPLEIMNFQRSTSADVPTLVPAKRKRPTGLFPCQVCGETFTTAAILGLHESCHREERQTRSSKRISSVATISSGVAQQPSNSAMEDEHCTVSTVAAVRALIADSGGQRQASKNVRRKRGEYRRYTPEIREAIVQHALRHGAHETARSFSSSLGTSRTENIASKSII